MASVQAISLACVAVSLLATGARSHRDDEGSRTVRFTGTVASIRTTLPVRSADVRLMYVDSARGQEEVFVDTTKSRIAVTDSAGRFTFRDVEPGHYLIHVRRLGFAPFEGVVTIDTAAIEMELAMTQIDAVLAEYNVTSLPGFMERAIKRQEFSGFARRAKSSGTGRFVTMADISKRQAMRLEDVLVAQGLSRNDTYIMDNMQIDWEELRYYPPELVVGMEIYRSPAMTPAQFAGTIKGKFAFDTLSRRSATGIAGGSGGIMPKIVLIWTYVP